ncbi:carbon starvation CstA family protein, partial [Yersinia pestis PY-07]
MARGW